jgi:uncharacterized membrane protein
MAEEIKNPSETKGETKGKNIGMAIVAYILFFVPLLTEAKNDPFVKYHVKQGLVLFLSCLVSTVLCQLPLLGLLFWPLNIVIMILFVLGVLNAAGGKEKPLPLIGKFADYFKF